MIGRRDFAALFASFGGGVIARPGSAEAKAAAFPTRPLTILVGNEADETLAMTARTVAQPFSRVLGQTVKIANRPGLTARVADAKTRPATVRVAHSGNGTTSPLAILRLQQRLGVSFVAVAKEARADRSGGTIDAFVEQIPREIGPRRGSAFKPLAETSLQRGRRPPRSTFWPMRCRSARRPRDPGEVQEPRQRDSRAQSRRVRG